MHLFGNLYESEMREVQVDGSLGGMRLVCYNYYLSLHAGHLHGPLTILLLYPDG